MKTAATAFALASAFAAVNAQGDLTIQSPSSLVQCQPALLRFSGGSAPYYISVLPGGQATAVPLEQLPTQQGTSFTWTVDLAAGQDVTFSVRDSTGAINYSSQVPIQASNDNSCLIGGAASAGGSSASSAPAQSAGGQTSAASTPASSSSSSPASRTPLSSSPAPASTSATDGRNAANAQTTSAAAAAPTGAATGNYAASMVAVAGVAGLVALFA